MYDVLKLWHAWSGISVHPPPCWKHLETHSLCCWLVFLLISPEPVPQAHPVLQKRVLLQPHILPPTTSNVFGKQSTNSFTANPRHRYPPLLELHLQTALLLFSPAKYPNSAFLLPATLLHHLLTHSLLLPLPVISQSSEVNKILSNCPNKQSDSDPIPTWLLKECSSLFPQSPILSTYPSSPASFIPLSRNPLSHHCSRNRHWTKKNSQTIGQSPIYLSFPK